MLEVKILKLRHMGKDAAVLLRDYIQWCDIFSPETAGLSEQGADNFEKLWPKLLELSRTAFRKQLISPDNESRAFVRELQEGLYFRKKPIHILERFSEAESAEIITKAKIFGGPYSQSFLEGAIRGGGELDIFRSNLVGYLQSLFLRDKEIGKNLTIAESEIRRKDPSLRSNNHIKLAVCIGVYHYPEKYTSIETDVVKLPTPMTETDTLINRLYSSRDWSEISDDDLKLLADNTIRFNNKG